MTDFEGRGIKLCLFKSKKCLLYQLISRPLILCPNWIKEKSNVSFPLSSFQASFLSGLFRPIMSGNLINPAQKYGMKEFVAEDVS